MAVSIDALFDAHYLPSKLLHREQELATLSNLIDPSPASSHPMNILVHGSFGVGRTTLLRFFGKHELSMYRRPFIQFNGKHSKELVADALHALAPSSTYPDLLPEKWTLIKRLVRKSEAPLVFIFDDVGSLTSDFYKKFLGLCKENGVSSMATAPRYFPRQIDLRASQDLDIAIELEPFTDHELLDIVKQRVAEVFLTPLPSQITEFMADIICILDFQRPATIVELLQNLHPLLNSPSDISADLIRQSCLNSRTLHYDFWSGHLSSLTELDATVVLLLQAIGQYFVTNPGHIYVTKTNLFRQFKQVAEEINFPSPAHLFSRSLNMLLFQDLLLQSRYSVHNYFTLLPAEGYLEIVELLLGEYQPDT
ncbi:MAG: hypothetical protein ACFFCH_07640 [Promethearchaeota archaeon]